MTDPAPIDPALIDPVALLQDLIRFDTTNPPGDEGACVAHIAGLLAGLDGVDVVVDGPNERRANLVARFPGRGLAPPLLLHGHSDVVPVAGQRWTHPPFEGRLVDGEVWGRGAIDMKHGLAMMISSLVGMWDRGERPAGDVVLAVVADEENGSRAGAGWLVEHRPELFAGVRYALGEEAGAELELGGCRFHPIVVAEKRALWTRVTLRGPGGHASRLPPPDSPVSRLGGMLTALSGVRLPRHPTPAADRMLAVLAGALPDPLADRVARLRRDTELDRVPTGLPLTEALYLDSVLRHTANPTVVHTGEKINVMPSEITLDIDGRILPGDHTREDFLAELRRIIGPDAELEVSLEGSRIHEDRIAEPVFGGFYDQLADVLTKLDPDAVPLPMITPASTDNRLFAQLGIRCYGWLPLNLPVGSRHRSLLHCADERVPADAVRFGTDCLTRLLAGYR